MERAATAQKPITAPTSIIPSTPRFSTPGALGEQLAERRVEERRPVGDARGDHDDEEAVVHAGCRLGAPACGVGRGAREPDAVADEQLAAERAEEDDPLDHADEPGREVGALERVARVLEPADQERDEADRERVVAGERGDDDPRVAVAELLQAVRVAVERVA